MDFSFKYQIDQFNMQVDAIRETIDILMEELNENLNERSKELTVWIKKHGTIKDQPKDDKLDITIAPKFVSDLEKKLMEVNSVGICYKMLPRTFVVSLISIFDAYLGRLVRGILLTEPDVLRTSEKKLSYSDLLTFRSFKDVKEIIIEREIEDLLRNSHSDQFDWLEKRLGIPLRNDLDIWPDFIELTERRNLYVHTDGLISNQYLSVCEKHKVGFDKKPKAGDELFVAGHYFNRSCDLVSEIGTKLGHVIWRKLKSSEYQKVDSSLNNISINMISNDRHKLAIKIIEFVISCKAWKSTMEDTLNFELNLAQAYKWNGQGEKSKEMLALRDYSTLSDKYKLAYAVLSDNFTEAVRIMKKIGKSGEVNTSAYAAWPIFREFRKDPVFEETYKQVFGEKLRTEVEKPEGTSKKIKIKKKKSRKRKTKGKTRDSHLLMAGDGTQK